MKKKKQHSRIQKNQKGSKINSLIFRHKMIGYLDKNPQKDHSLKHILRAVNIRENELEIPLKDILKDMIDSRQVIHTEDDRYKSAMESNLFEGAVDFVNPRFAFIVCEGLEEDIWVEADNLKFALDGDRVKVQVFPRIKGKKKLEGQVVEIIERKRDEFVGKIEMSERFAFVIADNKKMHLDIFVPNTGINKAKNGEKVIVKIVEWHNEKSSPVGKVIQVLGKAGEHDTEMHAILAEFDLPSSFPEQVIHDAEKIPAKITTADVKKRRDFREILTFTIDPDDAKDFDDALSLRQLEENRWEVGIHIADVSHYVQPDTLLDKEAFKRATSVYLVDRVVPMLPERLSNDLCSLKPHTDKLTFSAVFELDNEARILKEWFGKTIIYSDRRFTYEEAQKGIESGEGEYAEELRLLNGLAKKLTEQRFRQGSINFETTEVKFKLNDKGIPIGIIIKERKDAHRLIEEFMLLANKKVAEYVFGLKENEKEKSMIYRIHDRPDMEKLQNFSVFAKRFGYHISTEGKAMVKSLNDLIDKTQGTPQQNILQSLAIRTMAKAKYSSESNGHFGLAFAHYTHFTSPIRRYPDLIAHRLLEIYLQGASSADKIEVEFKAKHSTDMEKKAADAERASIKYKQVEYMQLMERGKEFEGVVTGVTEWGIYVEIIETKCEGMVRMADILDDFYELDADNYRIIGRKTKNIIAFGDLVKVKVKDTNLEQRTLDLVFVD